MKFAALPLLLVLAACSAEVENGQSAETEAVETLSVNNLVITDANAVASDVADIATTAPVQPPETAAPVAEAPASASSRAEPEPRTQAKPRAETAPKQPPKPAAEAEAKNTVATCTPEHREMGHC